MNADEKAIIDLTIAYTWALDTKNFDELRNVFTPDATGLLHGVACDDAEAIITRISTVLVRLDASQHLIGNHQVRIDGDTATCRCQLHSQHVKRGTAGGDNYIIGGTYEDRLVRTADGWRICHRTMAETWNSGNRAVVRPAS
ncbi:MAG: nuclear transport factor 2 family protein [Actinomycetota bacterium]|nr:nuclear transport factor 2 family protein [Actinomycetota bacterium]